MPLAKMAATSPIRSFGFASMSDSKTQKNQGVHSIQSGRIATNSVVDNR
jgi:hypothetical protein